MSYILYFLGFVTFYRISEHLSEEDTPEWYHVIIGAIWPLVVVLAMLQNIYGLFVGESE